MIRSPLRWFGGKFRLAGKIVALMPPHECYCEVFGGALHVLYRKLPGKCEVVNDRNGHLINFWRQLKADPDWLMERGRWALYSRAEFNRLRRTDPAGLDEREQAWRFFYLCQTCFGATIHERAPDLSGSTFGAEMKKNNRARAFANTIARFEECHARLKGVTIECLDWLECVRRYDRQGTLFYLDPPYYGHENDYGKGLFGRGEFEKMAKALAALKGKFILSINDMPETRELFAGFNILDAFDLGYSACKDGGWRKKGELLIGNFEAGKRLAAARPGASVNESPREDAGPAAIASRNAEHCGPAEGDEETAPHFRQAALPGHFFRTQCSAVRLGIAEPRKHDAPAGNDLLEPLWRYLSPDA